MITRPALRVLAGTALCGATLTLIAVSAARADHYSTTVLQDQPLAYYRLNDSLQRANVNRNSGTLGAAGNATNINVHSVAGAIAGSRNAALYFDSTARAIIPWNAALNPDATVSFTVEAWFYPTSDKVVGAFVGPAPIMNRYSGNVTNRQGWVYFQRNPDSSYSSDGQTDVGWDFRTYTGAGSHVGIDLTSQVPYKLGQWQHVVTVWDGAAQTASMYIDGVLAGTTNIDSGGHAADGTAYVANTSDHGSEQAVNGPAGFSIGSYNNTELGSNPFRGAVDEVAFYSKKLTAAQVLAHYQNATNAARGTNYDVLILSDGPVGYWRLDDPVPGPDVAVNMGLLQNAGVATHTAEVRHPGHSALAGRTEDGAAAYHNRNGMSTTTMPWAAENNPDSGTPFTFEAWLRPLRDVQGGKAPLNNRYVSSGHRTGWVIYQRNPNLTYPPSEGHGWAFRMYDGVTGSGQDVLTDTDYVVGQWSHLVVTWEPQTDNGDPGVNGNHQFQGILTAYFNGVAVASNTFALYAANTNPTEDATPAADFAVGSYNAASTLGNNPFEGDIDEVALYTNYVLTADQVLAHYQAGTDSHPATNYETLVLSASYDGAGTQALQPATYLRFNEPAFHPAANSGSGGDVADGTLVLNANLAAGPQPPAYAGFDASNAALHLDGLKQWASLNNPSGLNISGQITLEAWVIPDAVQGDPARIISHGPPTLSDFLTAPPDDAVTNSSEVFLRLEGGGANYVVGSSEFTNGIGATTYSASYPVPAADLGGSNWVHLVGTYDGANWKLYRNGTPVATNAAAVGALTVSNGDWAIGATGNGWADNFAGAVDEVAIYDHALSAGRVAAHYAGATSAPLLTITRSGNSLILNWSAGTLQQADDVTGAYTNVAGASAPSYPVTPNQTKKFYRLVQ